MGFAALPRNHQSKDTFMDTAIMTTKTRAKSPIFDAVYETASDLHHSGFIDKRKMIKFDALCLEPIPAYGSDEIKNLRMRHCISQSVLVATRIQKRSDLHSVAFSTSINCDQRPSQTRFSCE